MAEGSLDQTKGAGAASKPTRTPVFADYLRVFSYATKWDWVIYVVAALASIGAGITMPLMNVVFGKLTGQFSEFSSGSGALAMSRGEFNHILDHQALLIMGLFIGRWGLSSINKFCFRMIGIRMSSAVRLHYLQALFAQSIHAIDSMPTGAPTTAITSTSSTLQLGISEHLGTLLQDTSTVVAAIIIAFVWSWDITLVTSSLILYIALVLCITLAAIVKNQTATVKAHDQATAVASEAMGVIRLVMSCGAYSHVVSRYDKWAEEARRRGQAMGPFVGLQLGLIFFGVFGAFGLAFWYGAKRYMAGAIDNAGIVIVVLMSVMLVYSSMQRIASPILAVSKAMVAACELFIVIDAPTPKSGSQKLESASEDILFNDVTFVYPSRPGVKVLDGLSLRIRAGQNTALVGPSGSGKSTIVALVERWYGLVEQTTLPVVEKESKSAKPDESSNNEEEAVSPEEGRVSGSITVGGVNLEDLDMKWWRDQIGLVQQEPFLFNHTIFQNVVNGLIGTKWESETEDRKRELVEEACRESNAHEFVCRLSEGYDTRVGDGGAKLSGGQKQRLAIARSIIKKPQIIILDEATSAIDVKSEKLVQAALDRIAQNRTTITIAHRLSTIQRADNIIVLKSGKAVEEGTHSSLMENPTGVYSALVRAQKLNQMHDDEEDTDTEVVKTEIEFGKTLTRAESIADPLLVEEQQQDKKSDKQMGLLHALFEVLYEQRSQWPFFVGVVVSAMAVGSCTPLQAWLFSKVIGIFVLQGSHLAHENTFWSLMWLALAGALGLSYIAGGWTATRLHYHVRAAYSRRYLRDMLRQKLDFLEQGDNSHGSLSYRLSGDADQMGELLGLNSAIAMGGAFSFVGCIIIALIFSWKLGLVAAFATMPIMTGTGWWRFRHELQFDKMNAAVFLESSQFATEAIGSIRTVYSLGVETTINGRYDQLLRGHVTAARRKAQWTAPSYGFADSVGLACQALVFWYGGHMLASGELPFESFFVCFMAIIQGAEASSGVLSITPDFAQATAAANRIRSVHESATRSARESAGKKTEIPETGGGVRIELKNVRFKYPTRDVAVFDCLSLCIEKGQYAAFVGPSGSGKSTIIALLERFYELKSMSHGQVLCNGVDVRDIALDEYRHDLSLVAQEPTLLSGTIRDNILFGIQDPSSITDERLHQVCRDAFIHDFIVSLPEGYATEVGQKGVSLSGGQKQRISIACALIRNPKLLLLDEATSALDSESEKIAQTAFEAAREGRTMIAVAHRLSTIQNADVIFVLDQGRIIEKGTHSELIKKQGVYWDMCRSQALDQ